MSDVLLAKKDSLERCVRQVNSYYRASSDVPFAEDFFRQDAISTNIQRACELAIDIANHLIRQRKLGLPQSSRESFKILERERIIDSDLAKRLVAMVGFRNILIHRYAEIDPTVMIDVIENRLDELIRFTTEAMESSI